MYLAEKTVTPEGMTVNDYQAMRILPGNRIGWETRQKHLYRLSDLYTLGYLTEEEYDKRVEWVNNAQTIEQVNIVFTDLAMSTLSEEASDYLRTGNSWAYENYQMASMHTWFITAMLTMAIADITEELWLAVLVLGIGVIVVTWIGLASRRGSYDNT